MVATLKRNPIPVETTPLAVPMSLSDHWLRNSFMVTAASRALGAHDVDSERVRRPTVEAREPLRPVLADLFGELGDAGAQHILFSVRDVWETDKLELLGSTLIPQLRDL